MDLKNEKKDISEFDPQDLKTQPCPIEFIWRSKIKDRPDLFTSGAVCLHNTYMALPSLLLKIQKCFAHPDVHLDQPLIPYYSDIFQVSCLLIYSYKCKQKGDKAFLYPLYLHFYELLTTQNNLVIRNNKKLHWRPFLDLRWPF